MAALASQMDLEVVETRYRGHAAALAGTAALEGHELVLTLGGDGTVNEAINGLLGKAAGRPRRAPGGHAPAPGTTPRTARRGAWRCPGRTARPRTAAGRARRCPRWPRCPAGTPTCSPGRSGWPPTRWTRPGRSSRRCGRAGAAASAWAGPSPPGLPDRYFAFNAGLGLDAEVVRAIEGLRARGRTATPGLYLWTALRQYYAVTDRRHPALILERDGQPPVGHLFFGFILNTAPWTFLGRRPVNPSPAAAFNAGLDLFALRRLRTLGTLNALRQMISRRSGPPAGRDVLSLHDERLLRFSATRPVALQVDGEYVGEQESVTFRSVPDALRVIA